MVPEIAKMSESKNVNGFDKYEMRRRKYVIVYKPRSLGWTELVIDQLERNNNETESR